MKVKVIKSNAFYKAEMETIKCINEDINAYSHIVLCPDRYSLISEKLIFDSLNISSTFNIEVLSISKLFNKFCSTDEAVLSSSASILLIQKALINLHDKLKVFNNLNNMAYLSEEIYKALSQIISCDISFEDLKFKTNSNLLNNKLQDLSLIYEEYLKLLETKIDSNKELKLLCEALPNIDLSKTRFYLIGYDSFTKQILKVLTNLIKYSNQVVISVVTNSNYNNNRRVYTNEVYNDILNICSNLNITLTEKEFFIKSEDCQSFLVNNIFGNSINKQENISEFLNIDAENSIKDEIKNLIKTINILTLENNYNFNDIQVYLPSESYVEILKNEFIKFKIPFFIDKDYKLSNLAVIKFINLVLKNLKSNFYKNDLFDLLNSVFVEIESNVINNYKNIYKKYSYEFGINYLLSDENLKSLLDNLIYLQKKYKNISNSLDFINLIKEIINIFDLEQKLTNIINLSKDLEFIKYNEQTFSKLSNLFEIFSTYLINIKIDISELILLFNNICKTISVSIIPVKSTAVYIGFDNSYFENKKVMFCLGALSGDFPKYYQDTSLISDFEIKTIESYIKLSPSVLTLNKRNLFKAFTILTSAKEKLFISYTENNFDTNKQKSSFIDDIQDMFYTSETDKNKSLNPENIAYYYDKNDVLIESAKNDVLNIKSNLSSLEKIDTKFDDFSDINIINDNVISISMIEKYNSCPFKFFVDYAIKPKVSSNKLLFNEIGNIVHLIAKEYLENYENITDIENFVEFNFNKIIKEKYNYIYENISYKGIIFNIKNSIINLCNSLKEMIDNSKFKPKYLEFPFKKIKISNGNNDYFVNGIIDRVDVYKNYFSLIDYKTGNKKANITEIYYGLTLQLLFYTYVINSMFNLQPVGAFYLNTTKIDKKTNCLKFDGFLLDDINLVKNLDNNIEFKYFSAKISKDGTLKYNNLLSKEDFEDMYQYIIKLIILTAENIKNNRFNPNPSKVIDSCKYCEYKNFCGFNCKKNSKRKDQLKADLIRKILKRKNDGAYN